MDLCFVQLGMLLLANSIICVSFSFLFTSSLLLICGPISECTKKNGSEAQEAAC